MDSDELLRVLEQVRTGGMSKEDAASSILSGYADIGHTKIDTARKVRTGSPEVIYCEGKEPGQVVEIVASLLQHTPNVLATRAEQDVFEAVRDSFPEAAYNPRARTITIVRSPPTLSGSYIAVVTAGTADLPVAEEAIETARFFGSRTELVADVGVAGIHRLMANIESIRGARVVVAVAGMEGALASVVAGLVERPVIAVPTSVGYGSSFGGLAALLSMLNSCAGGVSVVNIDNGYGAGYLANMINTMDD